MSVSKKKILAIINPISGTRAKTDIPQALRHEIDSDKFDLEIVYTEYAGHATVLSNQAVARQYAYVLSVGGDGTCNEIAKTLIHTDTVLGIIPTGSGNGLARHLGIPMKTQDAIKLVNSEYLVTVDYCRANEQVFFCTCGVGFDALVSLRFAKDKRRGGLTYVQKVIESYLRYKPETYELISEEGAIREKAFLIACANTSQYGNNAYIAPHANMQDGKIDITVVKPFPPLEVGTLAIQLFTKTIDRNTNIKTFESSKVTIVRERPGVMHLDGEPVEMPDKIDVCCISGGLKVLVSNRKRKPSIIEPIQTAILDQIDGVKHELGI